MNIKKIKTYFEIEAGSITTKIEDGELKFLIIYRKKMDDYTLPKGHVEDGESLEDTAVRETFEETGFNIKIKDSIGSFEYKVKERRNDKESYVIRRVYNFLGEVIDGKANGKNIDINEGDMNVL